MTDILDYYARRAAEYDRVYERPERQEDLRQLTALIIEWLAGRDVLEVACGTGYWTAALAPHARSILATDAVAEVLAIARERCREIQNVRFAQANAFDVGQVCDLARSGGLAAFFWSHVRKQELPRFLATFHAPLAPGARVVLCDSRYVPGSSPPASRTDADGNSYQLRILADGSRYEVLKNFPSVDEVRSVLSAAEAAHLEIIEQRYFWCARYVRSGAPA